MRARALAFALALLAVLLAPGIARGDGDPASDVLIPQDVFHPYAPNQPSAPVRRALDGMAARARAAGYPIKVAVIADRADLGSYPYLISEPARYAELLAKELSFNARPRVLVVLPSGVGSRNLGAAERALAGLEPQPRGGGDGLARTAMLALDRVTAAAGRRVPAPALAREAPAGAGGAGGGSGVGTLALVIVPALLVVAGAVVAGRRAGRARDPG